MTEIAALNIKVETQQTKAASTELDKLTNAGAKAESSTKKLETATDKLQRSMLDLKGVVGGLAAAFGAYKVAEYIKDSALLAARYETLGVSMTRAGANAGYTKGEMDKLEASLRAQGIAGVEARQTLTKLAASHMDLSKASAMARAAQDLAVVANINSSEAFERLVQGIQTGQTETLRTLGLNVQFDKSYKDLAKQLKVNVDQLTEAEKTQARMNVSLEAAKGYAGLYEGAMDTAGKQINSLKRYTDDLAVAFGTAFNPATASIVKDITETVKDLAVTVKDPAFQMGVTGIAQFGAGLFSAITYGGTTALQVLGNTAARISGIFIMVDGFINRHQADIDAGRRIAGSSDPAKALEREGAAARDRNLTFGPTRSGSILAPGALEAEFNVQEAGRSKGPVVREQSQASIDKARTATASLVADLAKANDVSDEGTAKVAELKKKYDEYAHTLGRTNPLVKHFGVVLEFARGHLGNTPAEVHKATEEVLKHNRALENEISALDAVSALYGEDYSDQLTMLRARTTAQEAYTKATHDGADATAALREQTLTLAKAQAEIDARRQQAGKGLAAGFAGPAYDASVAELTARYKDAERFTSDRFALERDLQSKLSQLEAARLRKTDSWYDGSKSALLSYADSVGTAASRMGDLWAKGFQGAEDALSQMIGKGKLDLAGFFDMMRVEAARSMIVQPVLRGFSSWLGGMDFSALFSANGNAFGPGGVYAFANGAAFANSVVSSPTAFRFGAGGSNLGIMGEVGPEAIMPLKRGSDGKLGVAADGRSSAQPVTVQLINKSGQQLRASTAKVSQDGQSMIVEVILDAWARDVGKLRTTMQGG